jgi:hypothetical protein
MASNGTRIGCSMKQGGHITHAALAIFPLRADCAKGADCLEG